MSLKVAPIQNTRLAELINQPLYCVINEHKAYGKTVFTEGVNYCPSLTLTSEDDYIPIHIVPYYELPSLLKIDCFVSEIELPADAIYSEYLFTGITTDKYIIKKFIPISELAWWRTHPAWCYNAIINNGLMLKYIPHLNQTLEMVISAVRQNGYNLKYAAIQTPIICETAVSNNGYAIQFVSEQTPELCEMAVINNSWALQKIKNKI